MACGETAGFQIGSTGVWIVVWLLVAAAAGVAGGVRDVLGGRSRS